MDAQRLRHIFDMLDDALTEDVALAIRGGAAALALGLEGRVTMDIDVLPASRFVERDLRRACAEVGIGFNPTDKETAEQDYLEVVPEETLILPAPAADRPYSTVYRGRRLTVTTPPAGDLLVGKLKRLDPEDLADVTFLIRRFSLTQADVEEAFSRLSPRHQADPVLRDNLRYLIEDYL